MVPMGSPIMSIGYKYNTWKVIYFIATEEAWNTKAGINYLYKYPEPLYNVAIIPVDHPLVMSKLFGFMNEFDPHNKSGQSNLVM